MYSIGLGFKMIARSRSKILISSASAVKSETFNMYGLVERSYSSSTSNGTEEGTKSCNDVTPSVTLYQYEICPFCNKTKAFLDYSGISYETVEVNPLTKAQINQWSGEYRKVPIAVLDGSQQINGSDDIIDTMLALSSVHSRLKTKWKGENFSVDEFRKGIDWVEYSTKLSTILYPNICGTLSDSYASFGYVNNVQEFSTAEKISIRIFGSLAMYFAASKIKKKHNIENASGALNECLNKFERDGLVNGSKRFVSGIDYPNFADIAIFGTLRSVHKLETYQEFLNSRTSTLVRDWYDRMEIETSSN